MNRDEGIGVLGRRGWLASTPAVFRRAILSECRWEQVEAGALIQVGDETDGELIGLADGIIELRTVFGRVDTPIMHLAHPVLWIGYGPLLFDRPRSVAASAKTALSLGRISQAAVRKLLAKHPNWWPHFNLLALIYGDIAVNIAADLLIRDSERRLAAVLLRLTGRRFDNGEDAHAVAVPLTQAELAGAANMSKNSAGTMLRRLASRGLVEVGYHGAVVKNPDALRAFVNLG